ncbi:flagellar protein FlaG [Accumulibacter sp.]|uniref:flagellar protein FlaG n=1 Tax=Accumulibacter sp. TaxID=2053492 RepID=UPI0028C43221|nr:flagellar protein FlaG [Accumulibacter sp.]
MNIQPTTASLPPQAQGNPVLRNATPEAQQKPAEQATRTGEAAKSPSPVQQQADRKEVEAATNSVRDFVQPINSNLEFSIVEDTGQLLIKIVDRSTKDVIRQIPSEEMVAIAKALDGIKGLLVQQTA